MLFRFTQNSSLLCFFLFLLTLITLNQCKQCYPGTYLSYSEPYRLTNAKLSLKVVNAKYAIYLGNET